MLCFVFIFSRDVVTDAQVVRISLLKMLLNKKELVLISNEIFSSFCRRFFLEKFEMSSPTRFLFSQGAARVSGIVPETSVISPRSISSRNELEQSIHSLQSKNKSKDEHLRMRKTHRPSSFSKDEQERVQKKTFTKWVNIYLSMHEPSFFINDLFDDFKDGTKLVALLEVLSGQTIVKSSVFPLFERKKTLCF